ncbi:MAG: response regulator [Deltaproteobacteria bacterium]|nr:response regulator [Deltaproteobacteria bacterium]
MAQNILIVDDDVTALDIVAFLFEKKGFVVSRCADGRSAVDYCVRAKPDLLLVDLLMPELNGVETVKLLRSSGIVAPILAFTAVDDSELHQEAIKAGCNEVLTKPCPSERLLKAIGRYIEIDTLTQ